jgi:hypothetical protein
MDEVSVDSHVYFSIFQIITKYRIYFEFWKFHYMMNLNGQNNGGFIQMVMKQIYPTCRLCDKLNAEMTHCAIYGALALYLVSMYDCFMLHLMNTIMVVYQVVN